MTNEQRTLIVAYKNIFTGEAGKMVLEDLKRISNVGTSHFTGGPIDEKLLIYNEARRSLVLGIIGKVERDLDKKEQRIAITEEQNNG